MQSLNFRNCSLEAGLSSTWNILFTISKEYQGQKYRLVHYDFYRLGDPGIMSEDLAESIADSNTITIIEWGNTVQNILPTERKVIEIKYIDENTRELTEK